MIIKLPNYEEEIAVDEWNCTLRLPLGLDKRGHRQYKNYGYYRTVEDALEALVRRKSIKAGETITLNEYIDELNSHISRIEHILDTHIKGFAQ